MDTRAFPARRDRGGDGIQTTHALRLRLALTAISVVAALAVVLAPLVATASMRDDEQFVAVVALAALVFPLLGVTRLLPWAVAVLAGSVLVAAEHGDIGSAGIALCAAMVLLVGECVAESGSLAPLTSIEVGLARRLVVRIAVETVAAGTLAAVILAAASLGVSAGVATLALGLLATVSLLVIVAVLVPQG
jgi:hypothetical protein